MRHMHSRLDEVRWIADVPDVWPEWPMGQLRKLPRSPEHVPRVRVGCLCGAVQDDLG